MIGWTFWQLGKTLTNYMATLFLPLKSDHDHGFLLSTDGQMCDG